MEKNCPSCPFLNTGLTEFRELLTARAVGMIVGDDDKMASPICHSTGTSEVVPPEKKLFKEDRICRGARDIQLKMFCSLGLLEEPTDECWKAKVDEMNAEKERQRNQPIPIPARLQKRPRYRGLPVPFIVFVDTGNKPHFRVTDHSKWRSVVKRRCCGICGQKLGEAFYFLGGEKAKTFGLFADPHMHVDCAIYSYRVCPYLAGKTEHLSFEELKEKTERRMVEGEMSREISGASDQRPARFYIYRASSASVVEHKGSELQHVARFTGVWELPNPDEPENDDNFYQHLRQQLIAL